LAKKLRLFATIGTEQPNRGNLSQALQVRAATVVNAHPKAVCGGLIVSFPI
jgi:hypothetical protein